MRVMSKVTRIMKLANRLGNTGLDAKDSTRRPAGTIKVVRISCLDKDQARWKCYSGPDVEIIDAVIIPRECEREILRDAQGRQRTFFDCMEHGPVHWQLSHSSEHKERQELYNGRFPRRTPSVF